MIAFLDARHPEDASVQFRWPTEAPFDARPRIGLCPKRLANGGGHRSFRKAVQGHSAKAMPGQDDRFHDASVAPPG